MLIPRQVITDDLLFIEPQITKLEFKNNLGFKECSYIYHSFCLPDGLHNKDDKIYLPYINNNIYCHNNYLLVKCNEKYAICKKNKYTKYWCDGCGKDGYCRSDECKGNLYYDHHYDTCIQKNLILYDALMLYFSLDIKLDKRDYYNYDECKYISNPISRL